MTASMMFPERSSPQSLGIARTIEIVLENPGHTSAELARISDEARGLLARRLPDAANRKTPKIFKGPSRRCTATENLAITWWPIPEPKQ